MRLMTLFGDFTRDLRYALRALRKRPVFTAVSGCMAALIARRALLATFTTPSDLPAYVLMPLAVLVVTLFAVWLPARRAAALEPTILLRSE